MAVVQVRVVTENLPKGMRLGMEQRTANSFITNLSELLAEGESARVEVDYTPDLKVGDTVIWRGGWGHDAPLPAVVESIDWVDDTGWDKYGAKVDSISWADIRANHCVVSLKNGAWAYGYQLSPFDGNPF